MVRQEDVVHSEVVMVTEEALEVWLGHGGGRGSGGGGEGRDGFRGP